MLAKIRRQWVGHKHTYHSKRDFTDQTHDSHHRLHDEFQIFIKGKMTKAKIPKSDGVPAHLSPESKKFFRKAVEDFELDDHHLLLLVKALEAFDLAEKCRKILDKEGLVYTDRFGSPRARPETKILNDSRNAVRTIFRELGFDLNDDNQSRPPLIGGRYA